MTLNEKIESIESKVLRLTEELSRLRRENAALLNENEKLKTTFSKNDEMMVDLKRQLEKTQQALGKKQEDDPEHAVKLRKQIDKYIEEVSKCIEWLEKA